MQPRTASVLQNFDKCYWLDCELIELVDRNLNKSWREVTREHFLSFVYKTYLLNLFPGRRIKVFDNRTEMQLANLMTQLFVNLSHGSLMRRFS